MIWSEATLGPAQSRTLPKRCADRMLTSTAISTPSVMAARAEPDLARYRSRSRRASRAAIGARRPSRASSVRHAGASRITAAIRATKPRTSTSAPLPLPLVVPEYPNRTAAPASTTRPGSAERWTCLGGAGRPDRAVTTGILVIDQAGRAAAKYVATTARPMATPITVHGSWKAPIA